MDNNNGKLGLNVLMLNKLYSAIKVIPVRRAFILLYKDSAEIIHQDNGAYHSYGFSDWVEESTENGSEEDDFIHTPTCSIKVPRVIRLMSYDKIPRRGMNFNRKNIMARDGNRCQYCGKKYPTAQLSVDHVIPRSRGGTATWDNMVASCSKCNTKKGGRLPKEAGMKLLKKPGVPTFNPTIISHLRNKRYQAWKPFLGEKNL